MHHQHSNVLKQYLLLSHFSGLKDDNYSLKYVAATLRSAEHPFIHVKLNHAIPSRLRWSCELPSRHAIAIIKLSLLSLCRVLLLKCLLRSGRCHVQAVLFIASVSR
jgi:hypothetical protein